MKINTGVESARTYWGAVVEWEYSRCIFTFETQFSTPQKEYLFTIISVPFRRIFCMVRFHSLIFFRAIIIFFSVF